MAGHWFKLSDVRRADSGVALERPVSLDGGEPFAPAIVPTWNGTDSAIGHLGNGGPYSQNPSWYLDNTQGDNYWTCFGPYANLAPGHYKATWDIDFGISCPPLATAGDFSAIVTDAVGKGSDGVLAGTQLFGPQGVTWETVCNEGNRNVGFEFDVPPGVSMVEIRLAKMQWMNYLIAKSLIIEPA